MLPKRMRIPLLLISAWFVVALYAEAQSGLDEFQYGQLSRVHGSGLGENHPPKAGQEVTVILEVILDDGKEQDALHFREAGINAHLNITGPEEFSVPFEIVDGKIQAVFQYETAGYYKIQVRIGEEALEKVHALTVTPGPVDASSAWVMVVEHGDEAGDELLFKVKFWDSFRNPLPALDIAHEVTFYGSKVVGRYNSPRGDTREDSISFGEGLTIESLPFETLFVGRFKPTMAGDWRVSLVVNSVAIEEPTWPPMVLPPGRLDAAGCDVEGMGASFMREAGYEYVLKIVPGDVHGNEVVPERPEMGYGCSVDMTWYGSSNGNDDGRGSPEEVAAEVGQQLLYHQVSNAYVLKFQPMRAGTLSIEARVLGKEIPDSPMKVTVLPGVADANETSLASTECRRLDMGMAGVETAAVIMGRDKYGNAAWHSHDPFRARLLTEDGTEAESAEVSLESLGNGNYSLMYMVPSPGSFRIEVTLHGSHIQGSPANLTSWSLKRGGRAVAENTAAELVESSVAAGLPMGFLLHLQDHECYPAALPDEGVSYILELYNQGTFGDGAPPEVEIELLPSPTEVIPAVTDPVLVTAVVSAAGQFDAVVYAAEAGVRTALASMPGKPWPLRVEVFPNEPATGSVFLFSDETGVVTAGSAVAVNMTLLDKFGNELLPRHLDPLRTLLNLVMERTGGEEQEVLGYSGNTATSLNVTMAGEVMIHVMLDGQRLPGGQRLLVAPAAPEPGQGDASGNVTTVRPRQEGQIYLSLLDTYGNKATLPAQLECEASVKLEMMPKIPVPDYDSESAVSSCGSGIGPMNNSVVIRFSINPPNVTLAHLSIDLTGANGWEDAYSFSVEVSNDGRSGGNLLAAADNGYNGGWEGLFNDNATPEEQKGNGNTVGVVIAGVVAAVVCTVLAGALYVWMGRRRAIARGSLLSEISDNDRAEWGFAETDGDEESPSRHSSDDGNDGGLDSSLSRGLIKVGAASSDSHQASEARGLLVQNCDAERPKTELPAAKDATPDAEIALRGENGSMEGAGESGHSCHEGGTEDKKESSLLDSSLSVPGVGKPGPITVSAQEQAYLRVMQAATPRSTLVRDYSHGLLVNNCNFKGPGGATSPGAQAAAEEANGPTEPTGKSTVTDPALGELSTKSSAGAQRGQHLPQLPHIPPLRLSQSAISSASAPTTAGCPEVLVKQATGEPGDNTTGPSTRRSKESGRASILGEFEGLPPSLSLPQISPSRSRRDSACSDSRDSTYAAAWPDRRTAGAPQSLSAEKEQAPSHANGDGSTAAETLDDSQEGWEGGPPVLALLEQMMPGHQASMDTAAVLPGMTTLLPGMRPPHHAQDLPPLPRPKPRSTSTSSAVTEEALLTGPLPPSMPPDAIKDRRSSNSSSHGMPSASSSASSLSIPGQLLSQDPPSKDDPESSSGGQLPGPRRPPAAPASRPSKASSGNYDGPNETAMGAGENGSTVAVQGSALSASSALTPPRSNEDDSNKRPPHDASSTQRASPAPLLRSNTMPTRPRRRGSGMGSTMVSLVNSEAQAPATSRPSTRSSVFDSLGGARPARRNSTNSAALLFGAAAAGGAGPGRASIGVGAAAATAAAPPPTARHGLSTQAWQDRSELPLSAVNDGGKPPSGASSSRPRRHGQQQQQQQQDDETSPSQQRQVAWDKTSGPSFQQR